MSSGGMSASGASGGTDGAMRSPALAPEFAARVLRDVPLSKHTSWHVGGPADLFFVPRNIMDLASFMRQLPADLPLMWMGLGSNLLVRDGGVRGAVVSTHGALADLERSSATRCAVCAYRPTVREMGPRARRIPGGDSRDAWRSARDECGRLGR